MPGVAQTLQSNECGWDRGSLFETEIARLGNDCSVTPDANVLGETARSYAEDFVAGLELSYTRADRFHASGEIRSRNSVLRLTKSKEKPADTTLQHAAVEKSQRNGANSDENLIVVRRRLFNFFKFQDVVRRTVFAVTDRFHAFGATRNAATAIICGGPVDELEPGEENDKDRERAPLQDSFPFHGRRLIDPDDNFSSRVAFFHVAHRIRRLLQFVGSIDDRVDFSRLHQIAQKAEVAFGQLRDVEDKFLFAKVRSETHSKNSQ